MDREIVELAQGLDKLAGRIRLIADALTRACDALENERLKRADVVYIAKQVVRALVATEQADATTDEAIDQVLGWTDSRRDVPAPGWFHQEGREG